MRARVVALAMVLAALAGAGGAGPVLADPPEPRVAPPAPAAPVAPPARVEPAPKVPAPAPDPVMAGGLRLLLGSVAVIALVLVASRVVRRLPVGRLFAGADGPIRVAASAHLGPKVRLCLLEVGGAAILVAVHPQGIQSLHAWPQGIGAAPAPRATPEPRAPDAPSLPGQLEGLAARLRGTR